VSLLNEITADLAALDTQRARRVRKIVASPQGSRVIVDGREMLHFGSNDYLGLANDPRLRAAAKRAIDRHGVGAGASHLVSGHFSPHAELEEALACFVGDFSERPRALLFSTGYMANLGVVTALLGRDDALFADKLNHACLNDAALLSRAQFIRYPHASVAALHERLTASRARRRLIATDAVFSMDGDIAPLPELLELALAHDAYLLVDDAHGFGVLGEGRGSVEHCLHCMRAASRSPAWERIIYMGTLGKAAGVAGAFVCAHETLIEWLVQKARTYIFTTASPPALAEALQESLAIIGGEAPRRERLLTNIARLRERLAAIVLPPSWRLLPSSSAIQPLVMGDNAATLAVSRALWERGIWVPAIRPPTVPAGSARLRITLSSAHDAADIDDLVAALAEVAAA